MQTQKRHTADASGTPLNGVASSGTPPRHTIQWSCFNRHTADASGTPLMRMSVSVFIIATLYYSQSGPQPARCFSFLYGFNTFIPNLHKIKLPINAGSYEISTQVMHAVNCRNIVFNRLGYSTRYTSTTPFAPSAVIAPELLVFIAFIAFIDLMEDTLLRTLA